MDQYSQADQKNRGLRRDPSGVRSAFRVRVEERNAFSGMTCAASALADLSRAHLQRLQNLPQRLPEIFRHFDLRDRPIRLGSPEPQFGRQPMAEPGGASAQVGDLFNLLGRAATERG